MKEKHRFEGEILEKWSLFQWWRRLGDDIGFGFFFLNVASRMKGDDDGDDEFSLLCSFFEVKYQYLFE